MFFPLPLLEYNDTVQMKKNYECVPDKYYFQSDSGSLKNYPKRSCQFKRSLLGDCSGIEDKSYGYGDGQPCVIIKFNKVYTQYESAQGRGHSP